jgi:long-subunit fatty acid transport protein
MNLKVKDNSVIYTFVQKGYMEYARDTILPSAEDESTLEMPMVVGMGLSLVRNEKWLVGVDATYSSWSMPKYTENPEINVLGKWTAFDYTESLRFSLGGEKMADMFSLNLRKLPKMADC